ncbi:hypothetical protein [Photobacterium sanguinicancri]|uniref:hypothetical protein n=1 Tax=Photobacterium sanguinicancri TaxID=875932 RepID=UPI003D119CE5
MPIIKTSLSASHLLLSTLALATIIFCLSLFSATASASDQSSKQPFTGIPVSTLKSHSALIQQISQIITNKSEQLEHHIYLSRYSPSDLTTYVYWHPGKELWILPISTKDNESWAFIQSNANMQRIDLLNHVVDSADDVGSSTFLVDKVWASKRIYDAVVEGEHLTIKIKE